MFDRRAFLRSMVGGIAVAAASRTWPFRVYSFPTNISIASEISALYKLEVIYYDKDAMANLKEPQWSARWRTMELRCFPFPGPNLNGGNIDVQIER